MLTNGGNVLYYQQTTPPDAQVTDYDPLEGTLIQDESITNITSSAASRNVNLDTDGYISSAVSNYGSLAYIQTIKARAAGTARVYSMWGSTKSTQGTTNYVGPQIQFNRIDASNYWACNVAINGASYYINLWKYVAGVYTKHVDQALSFSSRPFNWQLIAIDNGDYTSVRILGASSGTSSVNQFGGYTVASRPFQNEINTIFLTSASDASAHWKYQGCSIIDYPSTSP